MSIIITLDLVNSSNIGFFLINLSMVCFSIGAPWIGKIVWVASKNTRLAIRSRINWLIIVGSSWWIHLCDRCYQTIDYGLLLGIIVELWQQAPIDDLWLPPWIIYREDFSTFLEITSWWIQGNRLVADNGLLARSTMNSRFKIPTSHSRRPTSISRPRNSTSYMSCEIQLLRSTIFSLNVYVVGIVSS